MPIYEYKCKKCGADFEMLVSVHATEPPSCDRCGSGDVRKLISTSGSRITRNSEPSPACRTRGKFT